MHMVRQSDELCKFFIAKFPEAKQIKFSDGKLYLADAGRKPKEVPAALCVYRVSIPMSVDILRERTLKYVCVCVYVCVFVVLCVYCTHACKLVHAGISENSSDESTSPHG